MPQLSTLHIPFPGPSTEMTAQGPLDNFPRFSSKPNEMAIENEWLPSNDFKVKFNYPMNPSFDWN